MSKKLNFRKDLYLSAGISNAKLDKLKRNLERKPLLTSAYLIVPAQNKEDQLDIFESKQLAWPYYSNQCFEVIGIAEDYGAALELIRQMVQECLEEKGHCRLREYLSC